MSPPPPKGRHVYPSHSEQSHGRAVVQAPVHDGHRLPAAVPGVAEPLPFWPFKRVEGATESHCKPIRVKGQCSGDRPVRLVRKPEGPFTGEVLHMSQRALIE